MTLDIAVCSLNKTLLLFTLLHFLLQGQTYLLFHVSLDFLLLHSSPLSWKEHLFSLLVLKGIVGLPRTIQLQLLQGYWLGHNLDYCDIEWFALVTNRDCSVIFKIAPKYCISGVFLVAQIVKNLPAMQETWVWTLGWEDPLEEGMASHSSILVGESPWTEDPGGLQLQRVRGN